MVVVMAVTLLITVLQRIRCRVMREIEHKGYNIVNGIARTRVIKSIGSGALPKALHGMFTSTVEAIRAIDSYSPEKDTKRGKTIPNG